MLFNDIGVEVTLASNDDFLKVKETLTRIGIASKKENKLWQSCHILHKKNRDTGKSHYGIVHFKELFKLDGKEDTLTEEDIARRNTIANLLDEWGLVQIVGGPVASPVAPLNKIKILPFSQKKDWELVAKYNIGKKKTGV